MLFFALIVGDLEGDDKLYKKSRVNNERYVVYFSINVNNCCFFNRDFILCPSILNRWSPFMKSIRRMLLILFIILFYVKNKFIVLISPMYKFLMLRNEICVRH